MFFALLVVAALPALLWLTARHTPRERFHAKIAYAEARGQPRARGVRYTDSELLSEACHVYIEKYGWNASGKALRQFLVRWEKEHPEDDTSEAHRPGRPQRMTDAKCAQCIRELRAGQIVDGKFALFKSLTEAAEDCPTVAACRTRYTRYSRRCPCTPPFQLKCNPEHGLPDLGVAGGQRVLCEHHMT
jgi:hypothetical protein